MTDEILRQVRIQYPTNDPHSLQRSITQIKELLENPEFWEAVGTQLGEVTIRRFSGGSGGGGGGGDGGASITIGDAFPTGVKEGHLHYKTAENVGMYVWYDDGDSQQWVQTNGSIALPPEPADITSSHDSTDISTLTNGEYTQSWRITGDVLEVWGFYRKTTNFAETVTIPLTKVFARPPTTTFTGARRGSITSDQSAQWESTTASQIVTRTTLLTNFYYHAIGEWDGVS